MPLSGRKFDAALRASRRAGLLIGVDEAGRGPLAGPLVVAAVRLGADPAPELSAARDSKQLSHVQRERIFKDIRVHVGYVALAWAFPREIERINILAATLSAMRRAAVRAAAGAEAKDCLVVVDGNRRIPELPFEQITVVGGDRLSLAVSCASIVAKVMRDRWMRRLDRRYPGYGLARHKGYGTAAHREALVRLGPTEAHRRTFAPVRQLIQL